MPTSCRSGNELQKKFGGTGTIANDMLEAAEIFSTVESSLSHITAAAHGTLYTHQATNVAIEFSCPSRRLIARAARLGASNFGELLFLP